MGGKLAYSKQIALLSSFIPYDPNFIAMAMNLKEKK